MILNDLELQKRSFSDFLWFLAAEKWNAQK